jgi:hypothetical protein
VAVDGTKFLVHHFLSVDDHLVDLLANSLDLVATLGDDLGEVVASSTVPGENLGIKLEYIIAILRVYQLTLVVSEGTSVRAP